MQFIQVLPLLVAQSTAGYLAEHILTPSTIPENIPKHQPHKRPTPLECVITYVNVCLNAT